MVGMKKDSESNNTIVILFFGRMGDGVMFLDALKQYKALYSPEHGFQLVIGCRKEIVELIKTVKLDDCIIFVDVNRDELSQSFKYFFNTVKCISAKKPSTIIHVRENNAIENVFVHALTAKNKIIYRSFGIEYNSKIKRYFSLHTYTSDFASDESVDQLTNYALLLRKLGATDYRSKIARYHINLDYDLPEHYIVVCPGASSENKCWPLDRYAKVLDYCVKYYCGSVIVCGGVSEMTIADQIASMMKNKASIINKAGETNIQEWFYIIQCADFVLTNESAAAHISALTAVPSICVGEQSYGDMWLPYRPEIVRTDDIMPRIVRGEKLECWFCARREFRLSKECVECIHDYGVKKCVYEVRPEMVISALVENKLLEVTT